MWTQQVQTYADYLAAGGEPPQGFTASETTSVITCVDENGWVAWTSFADDPDPLTRVNPAVTVEDLREP